MTPWPRRRTHATRSRCFPRAPRASTACSRPVACAARRRLPRRDLWPVINPDTGAWRGVSERQLERLFAERVGYGPKVYARCCAAVRVVSIMDSNQAAAPSFAEVAAASGYSDQPIWCGNSALSGVTPGAYAGNAECRKSTCSGAVGRYGEFQMLRKLPRPYRRSQSTVPCLLVRHSGLRKSRRSAARGRASACHSRRPRRYDQLQTRASLLRICRASPRASESVSTPNARRSTP